VVYNTPKTRIKPKDNVQKVKTTRRLKLNEDKTEFMWCGSRASLNKIASNDLSL